MSIEHLNSPDVQRRRDANRHGAARRRRAIIAEMWLAGHSPAEIGEAVGLGSRNVIVIASRMRKQGIDLPPAQLGVEQITRAELAGRLVRAREQGRKSGRGNKFKVRVLEMRLAGQRPVEIARILDTDVSRVKAAIADPDGQKHRVAAALWKGVCRDCGRATHSRSSRYNPETGAHDPISGPAERCDSCAREHRWGRPKLTKESMIADVKAMARRRGRTPTIKDLDSPDAPFSRHAPYVIFGKNGWTKLLTAAGLRARRAGGQTRQDDKDTEVTMQQRMTVLRLGGALVSDGNTVEQHHANPTKLVHGA